MDKLLARALVLTFFVAAVTSFGGSEDKFIKKYAMMKIYESCLGSDVVKQINMEMKMAMAKCVSHREQPSAVPVKTPQPSPPPPPHQGIPTESNDALYHQQPFDQEKLNQAILAYRPNPFSTPQYRPYSPISGFYPFNNPLYQTPVFYPAYQQTPQFTPYTLPIMGQPFLGGNRMSRDLDVRSQLDALSSNMNGKLKNLTCVMQELGYLDENLEPNFAKISERIGHLPVSEDLKKDMQDGVQFCQQFSQCVPEMKGDRFPLSRELIRPLFFFKCYKHKKLEACVMKDVREKYSGVTDDELDDDVELRRQGKSAKLEKDDAGDVATDIFDILYGSDSSVDFGNYL